MSRLCRLKTASHGEDGKWAYEEIVRLRERIAELEKDAARYKWLRDHHDSGDEMWFVYGAKSDNLDQDIDEAMKK